MSRGRGSPRSAQHGSTLSLPAGLEVLEHRPDLILAAHGCTMFRIWRANAALDSLLRCGVAHDRVSAAHRQYGTLTVVEPEVSAPTAEVRQAAGRLMARFAADSANALVLEGAGAKHTSMRLALTTIQLLAPDSVPPPVFANIEEASEWLAARLPGVSAAQLVRDVAALRGL